MKKLMKTSLILFAVTLFSFAAGAGSKMEEAIALLEKGIQAEYYPGEPFTAKASDKIDWATLHELNTQAEETWNDLQQCPDSQKPKFGMVLKNTRLCAQGQAVLESFRDSVESYLVTVPAYRVDPIEIISCGPGNTGADWCINMNIDLRGRNESSFSFGPETGAYQNAMMKLPSLDLHPLLLEVLIEFYEAPYQPTIKENCSRNCVSSKRERYAMPFQGLENAAFHYAQNEFIRGYNNPQKPPMEFTRQELASNKLLRKAMEFKAPMQKSAAAMQSLELIWLGAKGNQCTQFGMNSQINKERIVIGVVTHYILRMIAEKVPTCD